MSDMKMSEVKDLFFKKNAGCFTEDDVKSGDYSEKDVLDLLDGYESLLAAFSRYSNNHDRLVEENAELREMLSECRGALSACSIQETRNDGSENRMKIKSLNKTVDSIDLLIAKHKA